MTDDTLEFPQSSDELYLAAAPTDVEPSRPLLTGDVFADIQVPGFDESGPAIILTHPCSMRVDGVNLADRLLMARVTPSSGVPLHKWATGFFRIMPLPDLNGGCHAARLDEIGLVMSSAVQSAQRLACMTPLGINLLQQRFIAYLTRFVVPTFRLNEACAAVFDEADLGEEWALVTVAAGMSLERAAVAFHDWLRSADSSGLTRQEQLAEPQRRSGVRRDMRRHLTDNFGS